jgi:hypothetical protein
MFPPSPGRDAAIVKKRPFILTLVPVTVAAMLGVAGPADATSASAAAGPADAVLAWSGYGAQAITAGRPPANAMVLLGIEHVAMYDVAVALGLPARPVAVRARARPDTSGPAAIATAAHDVLVARVPAQRAFVDTPYQAYLAGIPDGATKSRGVDLGRRVATGVLAWRSGDGLDNSVPYVQPAPGPGVWEPTAPTPPVDIVLTQVRPLSLRTPDQFRPDGPLPLTSRQYAREVAQVQALGRVDSQVRTAEQTQVAQFWAENTAVQLHRAVLRLASAKRLPFGRTARLLAMTFVSAGDAGIACFDAKYHYMSWRPVHAVQRADTDGNPRTGPDPTWQPLLNVNHPEYPSGHACLTGAVTAALTAFFHRDRMRFTVDSTVTQTERTFGSFAASVDEVVEARIYSGLHFRHSMLDGATLGRRAAAWVVAHDFC